MNVGPFSPLVQTVPDFFDVTVESGETVANLAMLVYEQYGYGIGFWAETAANSDWLQLHYPDTLSPFWYTPDSVYFDLDASGLSAGVYADSIVIYDPTDDTISFPDVIVPVIMRVMGDPGEFVVNTTPQILNYVLQPGDYISDSLHVYEEQGRSVTFSHSESAPWLVVNPFEMPPLTTPQTMPVLINTDSLPIGFYRDTIWITSAGADTVVFAPVAVPVNLTVADSVYCGDVDGNGMVNITDAVGVINYIFLGAEPTVEVCRYDCNSDGVINISDAVHLISYIFGYRPPLNDCCP
jgi:hypothetical protein